MKPREIGRFLVVDPGICHGKLTFKGTRVPVETVLNCLAKGRDIDEILAGWPELKREAIIEAVHLARVALIERYTASGKKAHEPAYSGRSA